MPETREFKAELKQLLHLITHSLYSNPEIFLRELISNASDAINRLKFDSLTREELLENDKDWKIRIIADKEASTLTVSDNGIGMSREEVIEHLGTIAKSGTKAFLEALQAQQESARPELIGQFGVGFYSAFMVADKVTVITRPGGAGTSGTRWESDGQGSFTIEPIDKATRGTDVVLHLKADAKEFLEEWRIRQIVKKFSDFIEHPIVMEVEKAGGKREEETLNSRKAIWLRSKNEVTTEEYHAFYRQLSLDDQDPAKVLHYKGEGKIEFRALLFIPSHRPALLDWGEPKGGLRLYIQRVLIMEKCEALLPPYLRFVTGVIDALDLPLNVSREILQQNPQLEVIQKNVVRNVLDALAAMKNTEFDKYLEFHRGLAPVLKEAFHQDWANREKVADLLLFESMNTPKGQFITLKDYVDKMPSDQEAIWYLIGETREQIENSPYLEAFRARNHDVLLLTDPIDEFAMPTLGSYKGKRLQPVDRGELPGKTDEAPPDADAYKPLLEFLKAKFEGEVGDVRLSKRLTESAAMLVADAGAMTAHLERLMARMGRQVDGPRRALELNPLHPAVVALRERHAANPQDPLVDVHARLLLDQALIAEGSKLRDPAGFAKRINTLLAATGTSGS
ncbi:MAG: molecular chaperone HtpG [Gemmataceae bacterium]|nr:molecular chaperone HtpG [Gemmataceae bacterium]